MRTPPKGFTIFFATLVASLALAIGLAIYDITVRQLSLSTTVVQSHYAIFAADSGVECALYWDAKYGGGGSAFTGSFGQSAQKVVYLTSGSSWTVPNDWSSINSIEVIGGGGGGASGPITAGGGGGAYSKISNAPLTPNASIAYSVGSGGPGSVGGGDTYFNGGTCSTSSVCAKGGGAGSGASGGAGGAASGGIGTIKYSGGVGGPGSTGSGGGGGAAGPLGPGGNGGSGGASVSFPNAGGGGGGNGGGTSGAAGTESQGGNGGNNASGVGHGTGTIGNSSIATAGTAGGGGGGGLSNPLPYASGANGGSGTEWDSAHGSGGGGGSSNGASGTAGNGGLYGGGGGGRMGGSGAPGIIVIRYSSSGTQSTASGVTCGPFDIASVGTAPVPFAPAPTGWGAWNIASITGAATTTFTLTFPPYSYCAVVQVSKYTKPDGVIGTTIYSHGYNTCATNAQNQIERELKATY
ncbi:MAG TPA: hypothetical protein VG984_01315 [Candidatus Paceibacterota bacterium]|nr:hypothetical protein [Candidatus Paceibacterota bacterium]